MSDPLAQELRAVLAALAAEARTITYQALAQRIAVPPPHRIHKLTLALEALVREDHAAGRPLLAALAISRGPEGLPGRGFFQLLTELGRYQGPDRGAAAATAHGAELQHLWRAVAAEGSGP